MRHCKFQFPVGQVKITKSSLSIIQNNSQWKGADLCSAFEKIELTLAQGTYSRNPL